jgi:hypothetical protein
MASNPIYAILDLLLFVSGPQANAEPPPTAVRFISLTWATIDLREALPTRIALVRSFPMSEGASSPKAFWSAEWRVGSPPVIRKEIDGRTCAALGEAISALARVKPVTILPMGSGRVSPPSPHGPFMTLYATGAFPNGSFAKVEISDYGGGELTNWYSEYDAKLTPCWQQRPTSD